MKNITLRRIFNATIPLAGVICLGCHPAPTQPASTWPSKAQIEAKNFETEAHDPTDRILVSDTQIYPDTSGERILDDRRPLWVVEGRVTSNLLYANADKVVLKVRFVDSQTNVLDTTELTVQNINPQDTKAFRQVIPLLPPPKGKKFSLAVDVSSVDTSPARNPYPFYK